MIALLATFGLGLALGANVLTAGLVAMGALLVSSFILGWGRI